MPPHGRNRISSSENEADLDSRYNLDRPSSGVGRKIIIGIGTVIVLFALAEYVHVNRRAKVDLERAARSSNTPPDKDILFGGPMADQVLENPQITWLEQIFCTGYRKASMCSNKPLHPFYKYYIEERLKDLSEEQLAEQYGLSQKEARRPGMTIEQAHAQPQVGFH